MKKQVIPSKTQSSKRTIITQNLPPSILITPSTSPNSTPYYKIRLPERGTRRPLNRTQTYLITNSKIHEFFSRFAHKNHRRFTQLRVHYNFNLMVTAHTEKCINLFFIKKPSVQNPNPCESFEINTTGIDTPLTLDRLLTLATQQYEHISVQNPKQKMSK